MMSKWRTWLFVLTITLLIIAIGIELRKQYILTQNIESMNNGLVSEQKNIQQFLVVTQQLKLLNQEIDRVEIPLILTAHVAKLTSIKQLKFDDQIHENLIPIVELLNQQAIDAQTLIGTRAQLTDNSHQFYQGIMGLTLVKISSHRLSIYQKMTHGIGVILASKLSQEIREVNRELGLLLVSLSHSPETADNNMTIIIQLISGKNSIANLQLARLKLHGRLRGKANLVSQLLDNLMTQSNQQFENTEQEIQIKTTETSQYILLISRIIMSISVVLILIAIGSYRITRLKQ